MTGPSRSMHRPVSRVERVVSSGSSASSRRASPRRSSRGTALVETRSGSQGRVELVQEMQHPWTLDREVVVETESWSSCPSTRPAEPADGSRAEPRPLLPLDFLLDLPRSYHVDRKGYAHLCSTLDPPADPPNPSPPRRRPVSPLPPRPPFSPPSPRRPSPRPAVRAPTRCFNPTRAMSTTTRPTAAAKPQDVKAKVGLRA